MTDEGGKPRIQHFKLPYTPQNTVVPPSFTDWQYDSCEKNLPPQSAMVFQ